MITGDELETFIRISLGPDAVEQLRTAQGLVLWGSIGVDVFLDRNGDVWELDDEGASRRRVTGLEKLTNLVIACERRPQLRGLLPVRPEGTPDCLRCAGVGTLELTAAQANARVYLAMGTPLRFYCPACGGVGFVARW